MKSVSGGRQAGRAGRGWTKRLAWVCHVGVDVCGGRQAPVAFPRRFVEPHNTGKEFHLATCLAQVQIVERDPLAFVRNRGNGWQCQVVTCGVEFKMGGVLWDAFDCFSAEVRTGWTYPANCHPIATLRFDVCSSTTWPPFARHARIVVSI